MAVAAPPAGCADVKAKLLSNNKMYKQIAHTCYKRIRGRRVKSLYGAARRDGSDLPLDMGRMQKRSKHVEMSLHDKQMR